MHFTFDSFSPCGSPHQNFCCRSLLFFSYFSEGRDVFRKIQHWNRASAGSNRAAAVGAIPRSRKRTKARTRRKEEGIGKVDRMWNNIEERAANKLGRNRGRGSEHTDAHLYTGFQTKKYIVNRLQTCLVVVEKNMYGACVGIAGVSSAWYIHTYVYRKKYV